MLLDIVLVVSKKGMAMTAIIAAAVVGSSFLIWFLPSQGNVSNITRFPGDYAGILSEVYGSHSALADKMDARFSEWKDGKVTSQEMSLDIDSAKKEVEDKIGELEKANPAAEWKESYSNYVKSLESFSQYLQVMEERVVSDDRTGSDEEMNSIKQESNDFVEKSIESFPVGSK